MMKKLLSFLLVSVILFTSLYFETNAKAETVASAYGSEQSELLYALDVLDSPDLTTNLVTRAQFVKYAMKLAGIPLSPYTGTQFEDVQANHEYYDYIMSAVDFGLISVSDRFRPGYAISSTEAIKIIINLLGYDFMAQAKGGYPTGYLQTAQSIDLSKGIDVSVSAMTEHDVCVLLYNALKVNLPEVSYTGEGASDYYIGSATLLEKYRGIIEIMGIVDGVSHYSEYNVNGYGEGRVSINGTIYNTGTLNCDMLYGYDVTAYYNTKEKALITCTPSDTNRVVSIYAEDIESFTNGVCTYTDENNKSRSVSVNADSTIFYNGRLFDYDKLKLTPESGSLTFVSPKGSGAFSTLYITSYKTIVVSKVSKGDDEYIIVDKYSKDNNLTFNPDNTEFTIKNQEGKDIAFSSINSGDIVNVSVSDDKKIIDIICVKDSFLGTYSGYNTDYIIIDGVEYRLTSSLKGKVSEIISLGKQGLFKLDIDHRIADVIPTSEAGEQLGYLVVGKLQEQGLSSGLAVRILKLDGVISDYNFADSFFINDANYKDFKKAYNDNKSPDYDSLPCSIIKYTLDEDGKLKSIVYPDNAGGNGELYYTNSIEKSTGVRFARYYYNIDNRIICDTEMTIFKVPDPAYSVNSVNDELYSIESASYIYAEGPTKDYKLVGYSTNRDDGVSRYLLMQKVGDDMGSGNIGVLIDSEPLMVNKISQVVYNDNICEKMELCNRDYSASAPLIVYSKGENDFTSAGIGAGDIIRINPNDRNIVRGFEHVWKKGATKFVDGSTEIVSSNINAPQTRIKFAEVYSVRGEVLDVATLGKNLEKVSESDLSPIYTPQAKVFKYDETLKKVVEIPVEDLKDYKNFGSGKNSIIYNMQYTEIRSIFVVNEQ